ncbi:MAG: hypothetical protein DI589_05795 [Shinella sp.]|nr:MAG: hypothetical protein DI589_05795 [Shinella sp.]
MMETTRRTFLTGAALSTIPVAAVASSPVLTPEQRIETAIAEIEAAMRDLHPGWEVQVTNQTIRPVEFASGTEGPASRQAILIFGTANRFGPENGRWFVNHL